VNIPFPSRGHRSVSGRKTILLLRSLSKILDKDNLNRAYKRVKANKGAPGIDGMTIEEALSWLKEHSHELVERIRKGKYGPSPVGGEIPKMEGGLTVYTLLHTVKTSI